MAVIWDDVLALLTEPWETYQLQLVGCGGVPDGGNRGGVVLLGSWGEQVPRGWAESKPSQGREVINSFRR